MKLRKYKLTLEEYKKEIEKAQSAEQRQALLTDVLITDSEVIITRYTN